MNQYKEHITRLRDRYNAEIAASFSFYDEPEYTAHLPFPPDDDEHVGACAEIIAEAYCNGDYAHMWEALTEALDSRDDPHDELTYDILAEAISELQWDIHPINTDALNNTAFVGMVLDSMTLLPGGYAAMALGLVIKKLSENDDAAYANSLTIMEHAARTILARTPSISDSDTKSIEQVLPHLHHQSIADHIVQMSGEHKTSLAELGDKIIRYETITGEAIEDDVIFFVNADTDSVREAAQWWRNAIACTEEHGDSEDETVARRAHALVCLVLLNRSALPHKDLATLIDTMQAPITGVETLTIVTDASVWRKPITTVEQLIDYASSRVSAALQQR